MGKYQGYKKYKNSSVEWLGEIPEHWEVKRVKYAFLLQRGYDLTRDEMEEGIYPVYASNGIIGYHTSFNVKAPSITVGRSGSVGEINYINHDFWAHNTALYVKIFINSEPRFIFYLLNILDVKSLSWGTAVGTLNRNYIHDLLSGFPPPDEQETIARFLDHKTKQIDDLIAKKETLIKKLDEKRTALISHAVTKGLDPNVPMKDSGIKWLDKIPKDWESVRIKFISDIKYGLGEPPEKMDDGLPIIRATDIYRGIIDGSKVQRVNPDKVPWSRNPELKADDILVVRSGAYTGDSAIVPDEWAGAIAGYDMVLTPTKAYSKYIALNLLSKHILEGQIYLAKSRAAQPHLNAEELGNTIIGLPPFEEQKLISQYLVQKTAEINQQKAKIQEAIALLKEYRTALITNAVTGKIDVRQVPIP